MKATDIIIYIMNALPAVEKFLDAEFALSEIFEIELPGVKGIGQIRQQIIRQCLLLNMSDSIKQIAIQIKQRHTTKIPDALIAATAVHHGLSLLSADTGFSRIKGLDMIPLTL